MHASFAYAATALATLWLIVHVVIGGREVAGPLRQNHDLPDVIRVTLWMCWHMVTACIAVLAILPVVAVQTGLAGLLIAAVFLGVAFAGAGIAAQIILRAPLKLLPQGWLFVPVAVLCWLAL